MIRRFLQSRSHDWNSPVAAAASIGMVTVQFYQNALPSLGCPVFRLDTGHSIYCRRPRAGVPELAAPKSYSIAPLHTLQVFAPSPQIRNCSPHGQGAGPARGRFATDYPMGAPVGVGRDGHSPGIKSRNTKKARSPADWANASRQFSNRTLMNGAAGSPAIYPVRAPSGC
jgi:hypothetical protein